MPAPVSARSLPGLAVRRALADPALVAISALVVLVAATTLVAAAVHPSSAAARGAIRQLGAADPAAAAVVVQGDVPVADADRVDARVREVLATTLGPIGGPVVGSARSESFGLAGAPDGPLLVLDAADDLASRVHLVAGAWPQAGTPVQGVVLTTAAAAALAVEPGDRITLAGRRSPDLRLELVVAGLVEIVDRTDPAWAADQLVLDGTVTVGPFTTVGPLFVDASTLAAGAGGARLTRRWVALPSLAAAPVADLGNLAASARAIPDRLTAALGATPAFTVATGLPEILGTAATSLGRAGSGSTAVAGPLAAIAIATLVLVAMLLVERRRAGTALLRARGAGTRALLTLAVVEALLLASLAGVVGLPAGILLARLVDGSDGWGPGLLPVTAGSAGILGLAAGVIGLSLLGLLAPAFGAVGPIAELRRLALRRRGGAAAARWGVDLALLVVAGLLLARLLARDAAGLGAGNGPGSGGGLGILETATPGALLLAGSMLSLRLTPLAGRIAGAAGRRGRDAAPAIGGWSLSRRSDTHATVAMLLAGGTATVILAGAIGQSWAAAQRDQVAHELAADVTGTVGGLAGTQLPGARSAYLAIPGVTAASPVIGVVVDGGAGLRQAHLLAVPANPALATAALRDDLAARPLAALLAGLPEARPAVLVPSAGGDGALAVPEGTSSVRVTVTAGLQTGGLPPALSVALVTIATDGTLVRTDAAPLAGGGADVTLPEPVTGILAIEVVVTPASGAPTTGTIRIGDLQAVRGEGPADPVPLPPPTAGSWAFTRTAFGVSAGPVEQAPGAPGTAVFTNDTAITGPGETVVAYRPSALAGLPAQPLATLMDRALQDAVDAQGGGPLVVRLGLAESRHLAPAGTVRSFPGLDGHGVGVVDLGTWQAAAYATDGRPPTPTAWWLATDGIHDDAVATALTGGPFPLTAVRSRARLTTERIADPVADAVLGSLGLVAGGALLIALFGLVAASVGGLAARRGELAVARTLGMGEGGVAAWILAEELFPVVAGVLQGTALGLAAGILLAPALVEALGGRAAVPPVRVELPWMLVAGVMAMGLAVALTLAGNRIRSARALRIAAALRRGAAGDGT